MGVGVVAAMELQADDVKNVGSLAWVAGDLTNDAEAFYAVIQGMTGGSLSTVAAFAPEAFKSTGELRSGGDGGGEASYITLTNASDLTANSTGVGTILFKGASNRDSSGFIKMYIGTTAYYVPAFSAITG